MDYSGSYEYRSEVIRAWFIRVTFLRGKKARNKTMIRPRVSPEFGLEDLLHGIQFYACNFGRVGRMFGGAAQLETGGSMQSKDIALGLRSEQIRIDSDMV